jgi:hypothetical protein
LRKSKLGCPEETILQLGNKDEYIEGKTLWEIVQKQFEWEMNTFPQVKILNYDLHMDEATPHVHQRKVWIGHDENGFECVGQNKALEEMGYTLPDNTRKRSRYNNPKQTYTKMCREHFVQLCQERGIEIDLIPLDPSKTGLELDEYKRQQEQKQVEDLRSERNMYLKQIEKLAKANDEREKKRQILDKIQKKNDYEIVSMKKWEYDNLVKVNQSVPQLAREIETNKKDYSKVTEELCIEKKRLVKLEKEKKERIQYEAERLAAQKIQAQKREYNDNNAIVREYLELHGMIDHFRRYYKEKKREQDREYEYENGREEQEQEYER